MVAASKPTSWLSQQLHFLSDSAHLGGLSRWSGLFPSRPVNLIAQGLPPEIVALVFGVWFGWATWRGPHANSVSLPPMRSGSRLYLNIFRREPAISAFD